MRIINSISEIQKTIKKLKQDNNIISLVPTMGALHQGHISLIRRARKETDIVVVSIFVNPTQFGPNEDYLRYPRPFEKDKKICAEENVDIIFAPSVTEMYPDGYLTYVYVEKLSEILCGKFRPGHFRGVTTVVTKLFNIVQPDIAYFGEKDYQQLTIIKRMTKDLNFPVKIVQCKTIREKDGLAMSSRNVYLNETERKNANKIYSALKESKNIIMNTKIRDTNYIVNYITEKLKDIKGLKIEYIKICNPETLEEQKNRIILPAQILVALWIGKTRLIDNIRIEK